MTDTQIGAVSTRPPLRLWPGGLLVSLQWFLWFVLPRLVPTTMAGYLGALGGLATGLLVVVWWAFFSRAPRAERWIGALLMIGVPLAVRPLLHESMATAGQNFAYFVYALPVMCLGLVLWAAAVERLSARLRTTLIRVASLAGVLLLACGMWIFVRTEGVTSVGSECGWRWPATSEERALERGAGGPTAVSAPLAAPGAAPDWPGFRGPGRDGRVTAVRISTDWASTPPTELWRRPIGPAWSSFAVHGGRVYTQEQRGEEEIVSCYEVASGEPVWRHGDATRFWESNAGAGPRSTPAVAAGRVYTLGGTGILNALDAADGALVWSRDVTADTGREVPTWGFAGSPLVVGDLVVIAAAGQLAAYDRETGTPRWVGPAGSGGYSSPHLATLGGLEQVLLLDGAGATSLSPADGTVLWRHEWSGSGIVQPALTAGGGVLIGGDPVGTRHIGVERGPGGWRIEERWTSNGLKPYYSDFVVHEGHAYGFDGRILASIDLATGERNWKGGRYGTGQLVLLPEQDLLLVVSEMGELALVAASPEGSSDPARAPALEGKTWNHPAVVSDLLLVRNDREMAAFRLPRAGCV